MKKLINLKNLNLEELKGWFESIGEKTYRADQVFEWIQKGCLDFDEMSNLSKDLRKKLKEKAQIISLKLVEKYESAKDDTKKYLFETEDGLKIESVFMKYHYGNSVCISSQAGCRMGCTFCASGLDGLKRNLTVAELTDQVMIIQDDLGEKISHIVVMGTGEPLENYDNVKKFIDKLPISKRNITVSTCGLIPLIEKMGDEMPQVNLAISLHAANDSLRTSIMPINKKYPLADLMDTIKNHIKKTGRRVTLEYVLIKGVNDSSRSMHELADLVRGLNIHLNLISLNKVEPIGLEGSDRRKCDEFLAFLQERKIQVTARRELGSDIDAACGQLRLGL